MKAKIGEGATPGPWELITYPMPINLRIFDITGIGGRIAHLDHCSRNNARLIAKAPLLIEAVDALKMFTSVKDLTALQSSPGYFEVAMSKARALLAKLEDENE